MRRLNSKGMTLIEVVAAIAIFGIVMVTIFPAVLVLNRMNNFAYEKLDTAFVAQETIESVIFHSRTANQNELLTHILALGFTQTQSTPNLIFTRTVANYTTQVTLTQIPNGTLFRVLVVVTSTTTTPSGGNMSQLETIVSLRAN